MKRTAKTKSLAPALIIVGSIIFSIALANPVFFIVAVVFVLIFGDKL